MSTADLFQKAESYLDEAAVNFIKEAYAFAERSHSGEKRKNGDDFITHPVEVALTLAELKLDAETLAAALLHDTVEDAEVKLDTINKKFGPGVARMVDGVTKLGEMSLTSKELRSTENFRKMFLAMAKDINVVFIKLADRLHNMRTLSALPPDDRERIAKETQDIFVPLADRMGMGELKGELSDLSLRYLDPEAFHGIEGKVRVLAKERERAAAKMKRWLTDALKRDSVEFESIEGRGKHISSIAKKLSKEELQDITDLIALRVVVRDVPACYRVLGIIHQSFNPLTGKIKDYIATPKPNGYRSLHTTVFGIDGAITEIQIRTEEMHNQAEYGLAAHWFYNEQKDSKAYSGGKRSTAGPNEKMNWVKSLVDWQKGLDPSEFKEALSVDFFKERIFVFTPKGDLFDLPEGATAVDFAYLVHSELGERMVGAKANGKIIPVDEPLHNRDVVEILTTRQQKGPSRDWLATVKTSNARAHIKSYFNKKDSVVK